MSEAHHSPGQPEQHRLTARPAALGSSCAFCTDPAAHTGDRAKAEMQTWGQGNRGCSAGDQQVAILPGGRDHN